MILFGLISTTSVYFTDCFVHDKEHLKLPNPLQCSETQDKSIHPKYTIQRQHRIGCFIFHVQIQFQHRKIQTQFKSQRSYIFLLLLSFCWVRNLGKHLFPLWTLLKQPSCHLVIYCIWKADSAVFGIAVFEAHLPTTREELNFNITLFLQPRVLFHTEKYI